MIAPSPLLQIRSQFPALSQLVNDQPAVYFDAPGGTQVPQSVIDAITNYLIRSNSNIHGAFQTSRESDRVIEEAHQALADFLNCDADEVLFGANMTSLTFALSRAIGRTLQPGDEIITTYLDHDANVAPWKALEERGARVLSVDFHKDDCTLDLDDLKAKLSPRTKLIAVGYASNAVGTINPIPEIVKLGHAQDAWVFVDAVHYAPHKLIDVRALDCDFLACSTYKFFGPHLGVVYGKREHLQNLTPYKVRPATESLPGRWETGTQNHECLAGATACVNYLAELGREIASETTSRRGALSAAYRWIEQYESELANQLITGLLKIPGLQFYGIQDSRERTPTVSVRIKGYSPRQLATALGEQGIFTWDGNFYALNLTERLGVENQGGLLRIGLVHYNAPDEIERLLLALNRIVR